MNLFMNWIWLFCLDGDKELVAVPEADDFLATFCFFAKDEKETA